MRPARELRRGHDTGRGCAPLTTCGRASSAPRPAARYSRNSKCSPPRPRRPALSPLGLAAPAASAGKLEQLPPHESCARSGGSAFVVSTLLTHGHAWFGGAAGPPGAESGRFLEQPPPHGSYSGIRLRRHSVAAAPLGGGGTRRRRHSVAAAAPQRKAPAPLRRRRRHSAAAPLGCGGGTPAQGPGRAPAAAPLGCRGGTPAQSPGRAPAPAAALGGGTPAQGPAALRRQSVPIPHKAALE
jgi:hypothetical protein